MSDEAREEGFYWVILGQNPPAIAYWEGDARRSRQAVTADGVFVASDRLVFRPRLMPVA
jgi:hypothetical protein